jgi:hypothetical protein
VASHEHAGETPTVGDQRLLGIKIWTLGSHIADR